MIIKILFYKSSSKYYDSTCLQCEAFSGYTQSGSTNEIVIDLQELKEKYRQVFLLFGTLKNWSKSEYYINDSRSNARSIESILSIIQCEQNCMNCVIADEFCYGDAGWGCKYLSSVALRRESYYHYSSNSYWYEFGHFEQDEWIIDKNKILTTIKREAAEKNVDICTCFSIQKAEDIISLLPDKITVTDEEDCEWEFKYRDAPLGMRQTEIIGVMPKDRTPSGYGGLSFSASFKTDESVNNEQSQLRKSVPETTFDDIGGIDDIVQQVREIIELPLVAPSIFRHYHIKPHKGILLYGPPGCGKTMIAKAVANEIDAHFIAVNGPEILNKYLGQSESNLRKIFDEAKKFEPSVIYFDEFDSISSTRDADSNPLMASVVNQLLTLMDGIDSHCQICAIASTNRIDMIDEAIKRPGRFDYVIEIQKPSLEGCIAIFRIHTRDKPIDSHFDKDAFVEHYLVGHTGADIAFVVSEAAYNSIRRTVDIKTIFNWHQEFSVSSENIIVEHDFIKAVNTLKESRKKADTAQYRYNTV